MLVETANIAFLAEQPRDRPVTAAPRPSQPASEPAVSKERPEPAEAAPRSPRSRLAYDQELSRVFVEIVDPATGEVVHRFPPEQLVKHIRSLVDANSDTGDPDGSGLVLDRVV